MHRQKSDSRALRSSDYAAAVAIGAPYASDSVSGEGLSQAIRAMTSGAQPSPSGMHLASAPRTTQEPVRAISGGKWHEVAAYARPFVAESASWRIPQANAQLLAGPSDDISLDTAQHGRLLGAFASNVCRWRGSACHRQHSAAELVGFARA